MEITSTSSDLLATGELMGGERVAKFKIGYRSKVEIRLVARPHMKFTYL